MASHLMVYQYRWPELNLIMNHQTANLTYLHFSGYKVSYSNVFKYLLQCLQTVVHSECISQCNDPFVSDSIQLQTVEEYSPELGHTVKMYSARISRSSVHEQSASHVGIHSTR